MSAKKGPFTDLLQKITARVGDIIVDTEADSPTDKVANGETVLGTMDVQCKQLHVARGQVRK